MSGYTDKEKRVLAEFRAAFARRQVGEEGSDRRMLHDILVLRTLLLSSLHAERLPSEFTEPAKTLLLKPLIELNDDHFDQITRALRQWNQIINELYPWEDCLFYVFSELIWKSAIAGKPFPNRAVVEKFAMRFRALQMTQRNQKNSEFRKYLFEEMPEALQKPFEKALSRLKEPRWDKLLAKCGLSLLEKTKEAKGGRGLKKSRTPNLGF
jgi:hypothetical protein